MKRSGKALLAALLMPFERQVKSFKQHFCADVCEREPPQEVQLERLWVHPGWNACAPRICLRGSVMAGAACGQKHTERCPRSDQKAAQRLKIMPVVKGEMGLRGSAGSKYYFNGTTEPRNHNLWGEGRGGCQGTCGAEALRQQPQCFCVG